MNEKMNMQETLGCGLVANSGHQEPLNLSGFYTAECYGADSKLKWSERIDNLVTNVGGALTLDTILAGSAFTATVVMGLKGTGTAALADTQASHAGWSEVGGANAPAYSGTRRTPAFSAASGKSKATSAAVSFTFTSGGTVAGCFLNINGSATQDSTTGTLYSAGDFGTPRTVISSDVLNVTYTATA